MGNLIKKILIAPNSYKESIDSVSAARILRDSFANELFELYTLPLSDGGDGFQEVCKEKFGGDSLQSDNGLPYLYNSSTKKVYIESAALIGIKVIPPEKRKPLKLNSGALGDLLLHLKTKAVNKEIDINEIVIGVGGTATMDMGLGAASRFGLKLIDDIGNQLPEIPSEFINARRITIPEINLPFTVIAVNDVTNPLTGADGGIRVYGPQKGASKHDIALIEKGVANILSLISKTGLTANTRTETKTETTSTSSLPGAGGGLSAGLKLFFNAQIITSEQFIMKELGLKEYIGKMDYVITGEGRFDEQSFFNKAAGLVIKTFPETPVFLCCGEIESTELPDNVIPVELSRYFTSQKESIENTPAALQLAAEVIKTYIKQGQSIE